MTFAEWAIWYAGLARDAEQSARHFDRAPVTGSHGATADECRRLAAKQRAMAAQYRARAAEYRELATR